MQTSNPCLLNDTFKAQLFNVASIHRYTTVSVVFYQFYCRSLDDLCSTGVNSPR